MTFGNARERATDDVEPVQVGDLIVDPTTGEVVSRSAEVAESELETLTRVCAEAQATIKEATAIYDAARAALLKLLTEAGERSLPTRFGTPSLRTQVRRTGQPARVAEVVQRYELSREQAELIWMCAATLDAKQLDALAEAGLLPADALADLIEVKSTSYVIVAPIRRDEG